MTALVPLPYADLHAHDRASSAWRFDVAGVLEEVAAGLPRFDFDPVTLAAQGVLVEEAATNLNPYPLAEGGVPGVSLPLGWQLLGAQSALVTTFVGGGVGPDGKPTAIIRIAGTKAGGNYPVGVAVSNASAPAAAMGETWSTDIVWRVVSATALPGATGFRVGLFECTGTNWINGGFSTSGGALAATPWQRSQLSRTFNQASTTTARVGWQLPLNGTVDGNVFDFVFEIGRLQLWKLPFSPSPSYPPPAIPGPSTRLADRITRTLNHRFSRAAFTLLARGLFAQAAPAGMTRGVLQLDDGTDANRIRVENTPAGSALQMVVTVGGSDVATLPLGNMTPGTPFSVAMACADGDIAAVRGGGSVVAATPVVPPDLAFMRVGASGFDHANPMNGWYRAHRLIRGRVDNATLLALAA